MDSLGITLLVGFIFFLLGLFGNYFANWTSAPLALKFRKWRDDQAQKKASNSIKNARKRIEKLEEELKKYSDYYQNPTTINAMAYLYIAGILLATVFALLGCFTFFLQMQAMWTNIPIDLYLLVYCLWIITSFMAAIYAATSMFGLMQKLSDFPKKEVGMRKEIADLQEVIKKFEAAGITSTPKT
jgi:hypothetical protein